LVNKEQNVFAESFPLTKADLAAMLALVGKHLDDPTMSPTGKIMFDTLQHNLKLTFDKLEHLGKDFAVVRVDGGNQMGDVTWEYAKVPKDGQLSKLQAIASIINLIQERVGTDHIQIAYTDETSTDWEFLIRTGRTMFD